MGIDEYNLGKRIQHIEQLWRQLQERKHDTPPQPEIRSYTPPGPRTPGGKAVELALDCEQRIYELVELLAQMIDHGWAPTKHMPTMLDWLKLYRYPVCNSGYGDHVELAICEVERRLTNHLAPPTTAELAAKPEPYREWRDIQHRLHSMPGGNAITRERVAKWAARGQIQKRKNAKGENTYLWSEIKAQAHNRGIGVAHLSG